MPSEFTMKAMNVFHRTLLSVTFGKVGWRAAGMPVLELTTTGRKTGEKRSVMLTSPISDEHGTVVVVASRGGDDQHPAWYLNLLTNPNVEVVLEGGPRMRKLARVASPEERARLWPALTAKHKNYAGYQEKTAREIPLVLLEDPPA